MCLWYRLAWPTVEKVGEIKFDMDFEFDLHKVLGIEDDGVSFLDDLAKSCSPEALEQDIADAIGGDCYCAAKDVQLAQGDFCLDWDFFNAPTSVPAFDFVYAIGPGVAASASYKIASQVTGFDRCTCCEDGIYDNEGCGGMIAYCGTTPPPTKKALENLARVLQIVNVDLV